MRADTLPLTYPVFPEILYPTHFRSLVGSLLRAVPSGVAIFFVLKQSKIRISGPFAPVSTADCPIFATPFPFRPDDSSINGNLRVQHNI